MNGTVTAVSRSPEYSFSKPNADSITLLEGLGVEGDSHLGKTVRHRARVKLDLTVPNLRQVHLIHAELFDELRAAGFDLTPGLIGENVTTSGIDLLALPTGTKLHLGDAAVIEVTGLRNPCLQLDRLMPGLMKATLPRDADGKLVRKAGVMSVVLTGGVVRPGDTIRIELPPEPYTPLEPV